MEIAYILDVFRMVRDVKKEYLFAKTTAIKESGLMITDTLDFRQQIKDIIKEILKMILGMGKVNSVGKMEKNIKDNGNVV
jgi:hypothetical protein